MAIKIVKSTGNARRQLSYVIFDIDKKKPEKNLTSGKKSSSGRNVYGRITIRNRGAGAKRNLRLVDFSRLAKKDQKAKVINLEYDPNRSAHIALIKYEDGDISYILAPMKLKRGASVICAEKAPIRPGNRMMLKNIPSSSEVFCIELAPSKGGQIVRSAGARAILLGFEGEYAQIKMPSGEVRKVFKQCYATIGSASNEEHFKEMIGKAGRKRSFGRRPHVRGKARNPVDHPHGGGEGGVGIGLKRPKTPWGMPALGHKTRHKKLKSSALIVEKRK